MQAGCVDPQLAMKPISICMIACWAALSLVASCNRESPPVEDDSTPVERKSKIPPNIPPIIPDLPEPVQPILSEHEKLADKTMRAMGEFVATAAGVTDLQSARSAAEKIAGIGAGFTEIAEELRSLGVPDVRVQKQIAEKLRQHDEEMQKTMGDSLQAMVESLEPDAMKVMQEAVAEFFGKLEAVNAEFERQVDGESQPTNE